jgi:ferredoxin
MYEFKKDIKKKKLTEITKEELNQKVKPTYKGKNIDCTFRGSTKIFKITPQPGEVIKEEVKKGFPISIANTFKTWNLARKSKYGNINKKGEALSRIDTTPEFWEEFEQMAKEKGVQLINYMPVMEEFVFYDIEAYGKNMIILGQEMLWDRIKTANSTEAAYESMRLQDVLGNTTLELTEYLQEQGYKAEAQVPFGGKILVPPHIVAATLAIKGKAGLPITPEFGPRMRWSMITVDCEIPETKKRDLSELQEFCDNCSLCVKACLGEAIFKEPIEKEGGILTHIDREACLEMLRTQRYCSLCLKVCPPAVEPKAKKFKKILNNVEYSLL